VPIVVLVIVVTTVAALQLTGGVALEKHDEELYSIQAPKGYEKKGGQWEWYLWVLTKACIWFQLLHTIAIPKIAKNSYKIINSLEIK